MTTEEIAYIAGLLEGEGCFYTHKSGSPIVQVTMTDADIIHKARLIIGSSSPVHRHEDKLGNKPKFMLRIHGHKAIELMKTIRPLMGLRRGQKIDDVISEYELNPKTDIGKCKRGHDLTNPSNYYVNMTSGSKQCRMCDRIRKIRRGLKVVS